MSHASRWRSKSNTQVKTHHLQDCNGWTHVIRGPLQTSRLLISQSPYAAVHVGKVEIPDGFTLEDAQNAHIRFTERWESSKCFKWLVNLFEQTILNLERLRIDSCVVTGLGSFTKNEATGNNSSFYQLAAFETMLRLMKRRFRINQVYFQEPIFTKLDEDLLTSKGFTVVQDPEATDLVTESTFLYAPCNEWSTIYTILERTHPALYVGNELILSCNHHGFGSFPDRTEEGKEERHRRHQRGLQNRDKITAAFLEDRSSEHIPEFESNISAMNSVVYWQQAIREDPAVLRGLELDCDTNRDIIKS